MSYHHFPSQNYPQRPAGAPPGLRQKRRMPVFLVWSLSMIVALMAALVILRVMSVFGWTLFPKGISQHYGDPDFSAGDGSNDVGEYDFPWSRDNTTTSSTTIPRADPAPGVQLVLTEHSEQVMSFQDIYHKVIPSIVSIQASGSDGAYEGTGVIMTADGYVVTNYHIISGCSSAQVVLADRQRYTAKLVGSDSESDLAVLKVEAEDLTPAEFGDSNHLQVGDTVVAIGNPLGSELFGTMTDGIVSALNRDVTVQGYDMTLIQTTAALNPGNSGGALINSAGQVVGITNMKMMSDNETIEGLGFAIPTTQVQTVVNTLLTNGAVIGRPTIGITCRNITAESAEVEFGQESGVYIESVTARGPADLAGICVGDIVIAANGKTVETMEDLTDARDDAGVGGTLMLTVWRDGKIHMLTLTLVDQYELN